MSMTENEIKEATIEDAIYCAKAMACIEVCEECRFYRLCHTWCDDVYRLIVDALEEIQQYREIGTVEDFKRAKAMENVYGQVKWERDVAISQLEEIGISLGQKMDEFKALKEKSVAKKVLPKGTHKAIDNFYCPNCISPLTNRYEQCELPYCEMCGQRLDWNE